MTPTAIYFRMAPWDYSWDAENRLVGISYPGTPGKSTAFTYDGLSRRTAITSTPAGGSAVTTSYIWCGTHICQARDASGATTREYFTEGEFVPGTPGQPYFYGVDQIGSVRRVFASPSSAPAFSYDPYGNALQSTAPLTDLNYAGMFYNADSGLYLTQFRAYDPVSGRWLSRDPLGEKSDAPINLYQYVTGNPISLYDPDGLAGKGERGYTKSPGGTNNPGKYWKPDPNNPGYGWQKDPQTGKKVYKKRPPYIPCPENPNPDDNNNSNLDRLHVPPWIPFLPFLLPWPGNPLYGGF